MKHASSFFLPLTLLLFTTACAHVGTPGGGPKDVWPPKLVKTLPRENQTLYSQKKIQLFFDELVSIEGGTQNVIISPPQLTPPQIKAIGDKIVVEFNDTLKKETTYTVDFTDAIVDYNEKNKFGDYAFSFSTGKAIDSLRISGYLIDASNLNPVSGVLVGAHEDLNDSSFYTKPMTRISRTSKAGFFSIKGLPDKTFRVFALADKDRDYTYDQHAESIAYLDDVFHPWVEGCVKLDTVWKDSVTIDSVYHRTVPCYKPDDVVLRYFTEDFGRQYLTKRERPSREQISLTFNRPAASLPILRLLNSPAQNWYMTQKNLSNDSIRYWITDSSVIKMDTLVLQLDYFKTDSTNRLMPQTDTLKLISRPIKPKAQTVNRKSRDGRAELVSDTRHLKVQVGISDVVEMNQKPIISIETPIFEMPKDAWNLYKKVDTTWSKMPCRIETDTLSLCQFKLAAAWEYGGVYKLSLDSGVIRSIYGFSNNKQTINFRVRNEDEYSQLNLTVSGIEGKGFVELLDGSDKVLRRQPLVGNKANFEFLIPGTYYLRAVADANGNGKWDTGDYVLKRQPEQVYYRPESVRLRANWVVEESWNVNLVPLIKQKPKALQVDKQSQTMH